MCICMYSNVCIFKICNVYNFHQTTKLSPLAKNTNIKYKIERKKKKKRKCKRNNSPCLAWSMLPSDS